MVTLSVHPLRRWTAVVLGLAFVLAARGAPTALAAPQFPPLSVESLVNPDGTLNLATGQRGTVDLRGCANGSCEFLETAASDKWRLRHSDQATAPRAPPLRR